MIGVIIWADGRTERRDFGPDGNPQYEMMREVLEGYLQAIPGPSDSTIWMNEEGKIIGLPENRLATNAFKRWLMVNDRLNGNVIVTGSPNSSGEATSIDETLEKFLLTSFSTLRK